MQVDETLIGKRKYNRGRRQRVTGYWIASYGAVTEQEGRMMDLTHWKLVKTRDRATLQACILLHMASARTVDSAQNDFKWKFGRREHLL